MLVEILKLEIVNFWRAQGIINMNNFLRGYSKPQSLKGIMPWVAKIIGLDSAFKFKREFLRGQKDYSEAHRNGTNIYLYFYLEPNQIYEVFKTINKKSEKSNVRYFIKTGKDGGHEIINEEEVIEWLSKKNLA